MFLCRPLIVGGLVGVTAHLVLVTRAVVGQYYDTHRSDVKVRKTFKNWNTSFYDFLKGLDLHLLKPH